MTDTPLLKLDNVSVGYDRNVVLAEVSLKLMPGSFTGLLGANGSGKSTLIKTLLRIIPPLTGRVVFNPVGGAEMAFGYVPQRESLDPIYLLSSFEVVLMGVCGRVGPGRVVNRSEREWALQCMTRTGAEQLARKQFSELSGGQKQRVLIARALAAKPDFLLLDEPTSGIDVAAKHAVMEVLRQVHESQHLTILMASHDLPTVRAYARHVIWLHDGKILEGPVEELLSRERVESILDLELP